MDSMFEHKVRDNKALPVALLDARARLAQIGCPSEHLAKLYLVGGACLTVYDR